MTASERKALNQMLVERVGKRDAADLLVAQLAVDPADQKRLADEARDVGLQLQGIQLEREKLAADITQRGFGGPAIPPPPKAAAS